MEVFLLLLFSGRILKGLVLIFLKNSEKFICDAICSRLFLLEGFFFLVVVGRFLITDSILFVIDTILFVIDLLRIFLLNSVLVCFIVFLGIYILPLGCPICWHVTAHNSPLWTFFFYFCGTGYVSVIWFFFLFFSWLVWVRIFNMVYLFKKTNSYLHWFFFFSISLPSALNLYFIPSINFEIKFVPFLVFWSVMLGCLISSFNEDVYYY